MNPNFNPNPKTKYFNLLFHSMLDHNTTKFSSLVINYAPYMHTQQKSELITYSSTIDLQSIVEV